MIKYSSPQHRWFIYSRYYVVFTNRNIVILSHFSYDDAPFKLSSNIIQSPPPTHTHTLARAYVPNGPCFSRNFPWKHFHLSLFSCGFVFRKCDAQFFKYSVSKFGNYNFFCKCTHDTSIYFFVWYIFVSDLQFRSWLSVEHYFKHFVDTVLNWTDSLLSFYKTDR
jgi:hypothetical protein